MCVHVCVHVYLSTVRIHPLGSVEGPLPTVVVC